MHLLRFMQTLVLGPLVRLVNFELDSKLTVMRDREMPFETVEMQADPPRKIFAEFQVQLTQ